MSDEVTDFRVIPLAVFRCLECENWVKVEHLMPTRAHNYHTCSYCRTSYVITWNDQQPEATHIEMVRGKGAVRELGEK